MVSRTTICLFVMLWVLTMPGIKGWKWDKIRCLGPPPLERGPNTFNPPVDSRTILASVGYQKEYNRDITDYIGLRCFPAWQEAVHQADVEPNGETVPPARSAQRLVCPLSQVLSGSHLHFSCPDLQSSNDATRLGQDRSWQIARRKPQ